jgi:hypothetical protein
VTALRICLGSLGVLLGLWGAWLLVPVATAEPLSLGGWLLGGPVLHDLLLAPLTGAVALGVSRLGAWRVPVAVGLVLTGVLVALAVPLLWRAHAGPPNPGLHDRPYPLGLLAALLVLWTPLLVVPALRRRRARAPGPRR